MRRAQWRMHAAAFVAVAMIGVVSAPGGATAASSAARLTFSSVNLSFYNYVHPWEAARMAQGGVRTLRFSFDWFGVEAKPGHYNWAGLDRLVGNLASQGTRPA